MNRFLHPQWQNTAKKFLDHSVSSVNSSRCLKLKKCFKSQFWWHKTVNFSKFLASTMTKYSYEIFRPFCIFSEFLQMFKFKKMLQKSILMAQNCKFLKLRVFAHTTWWGLNLIEKKSSRIAEIGFWCSLTV